MKYKEQNYILILISQSADILRIQISLSLGAVKDILWRY